MSRPALVRSCGRARASKLPMLATLGVIVASLTLAACGGSSSSPSASSAAKEQQAEVKNADFAKCLREHGIEATAATAPGGEGQAVRVRASGGPAKMEAAQTACKKYQPEPHKLNLSPQEKVERAEAVEKFAKCMREHGIEVHAASSEGGFSIRIHGKPGAGPNPESPAFQKAQSSCQGLLPFKKGVHGGPPPKQLSGGAEGHTANAPGGSEGGAVATGG
jgi:hypothetical protein